MRLDLIERLERRRIVDDLDDDLLDPGQIHDAFAHHSGGDMAILGRLVLFVVEVGRIRVVRRPRSDELLIQHVLDIEQRHRDALEHRGVFDRIGGHDFRKRLSPGPNDLARGLETEHAERVGDLPQHFELGLKLGDTVHAGPYEDIQHVLDLTEILLDGFGNCPHEVCAGAGQILTRLLDLFGVWYRILDVESLLQIRQALVVGRGAGDVVQQRIHELDRGRADYGLLATIDEQFQLTINLAQQPLDRYG